MKEKKNVSGQWEDNPESKEKKRTATAVNSTRTHTEKKNVGQRKKNAPDETTDTQRAPTAAHTILGNNQFTILTWG